MLTLDHKQVKRKDWISISSGEKHQYDVYIYIYLDITIE